MFNDYPDVMTPKQVAEALGLGLNSIYQLIKDKTIGVCRVGRKILIPKLCLIDFVKSARYNTSEL